MRVNRIALALLIALTVQAMLDGMITYECHSESDSLPKFYAAPFVYSTDYHWVNSMSATLFVKGWLANSIVLGSLVYGLLALINHLSSNYLRRALNITGHVVAGVCLLTLVVHFALFDLSFQWGHDSFFMAGWAEPAPCDWRFSEF